MEGYAPPISAHGQPHIVSIITSGNYFNLIVKRIAHLRTIICRVALVTTVPISFQLIEQRVSNEMVNGYVLRTISVSHSRVYIILLHTAGRFALSACDNDNNDNGKKKIVPDCCCTVFGEYHD